MADKTADLVALNAVVHHLLAAFAAGDTEFLRLVELLVLSDLTASRDTPAADRVRALFAEARRVAPSHAVASRRLQ